MRLNSLRPCFKSLIEIRYNRRFHQIAPRLDFNTRYIDCVNYDKHGISKYAIYNERRIHLSRPCAAKGVSTMKLPSLGDSISEGTLSQWKKNVGDPIAVDEPLALVETDKLTVDINSTISGVIVKRYYEEGDVVYVGKPIIDVNVGGTPQQVVVESKGRQEPSEIKEDIKMPPEQAPIETRVPLSRMRLKIGERLKEAQNNAVMLTTFNECDMGDLMELRESVNKSQKYPIKLGYVSAYMRAATLSLEKMPIMNSYIQGTDIVTKHHVDISVAVSTPTGLVVPVVANCNGKSWHELEEKLVDVARLARQGKLTLEEMTGGTFTISNGGVYGSMLSTPILNPPQSSILGMHSITKRVVVKDNKMVIRPVMYLALSYDHRLVDGREAVTFLNSIKGLIENPSELL